jgi:hypothetical protein
MTRVWLWVAAVVVALVSLTYQDRTGPTYPLEGTFQSAKGPIAFKFLRSETIGTDLSLVLIDPVPSGVSASVKYRRYKSADDWTMIAAKRRDGLISRAGAARNR